MRIFGPLLILVVLSTPLHAQSDDEKVVEKLFDRALHDDDSYRNLEYLTKKIGARLSGSPAAEKAVSWTREVLSTYADTVFLQPVMVPHWVRGKAEVGKVLTGKTSTAVAVCALGNSVGTGPRGIAAPVVEVNGLDEVRKIGAPGIKGKIVFYNRPMERRFIHAFSAYESAVDQRVTGASEAARLGAVGVIVRSMSTESEDYPHTGTLRYLDDAPKIPAVAISTNDADKLSGMLKQKNDISFYMETHCQMLPEVLSYNVVAEIKGRISPDEYIVVGGHLDSWDLGEGAHDDGAGIVQSMEVLRLFKSIAYAPSHTIRAVMFMNEENGLRGGMEYARLANLRHEKHIAALESDEGGFTPRGFTLNGTDQHRAALKGWSSLLNPYGLVDFDRSGGGADISPLEDLGVPCFGYLPDSQRYFSYHHTSEDTFDKINRRELQMGAASMAALVYLIDRHGLDK